MNATLSSARRIGATFAIAGIAALGSVALAPAASAAPADQADAPAVDGPISVIDRSDKVGGPDKFIVFEHGRVAVFFCDEDQPNKHHNTCEAAVADGPRF